MKKSITLSLAITLLTAPAFGFKQEDLDKLKAMNGCEKCSLSEADLTGADLREADLTEAELNFADLSDSDLTGADLSNSDLTGTTFCNTMMPDGSVNNADC